MQARRRLLFDIARQSEDHDDDLMLALLWKKMRQSEDCDTVSPSKGVVLDSLSRKQISARYRFQQHHIPILAEKLQLPRRVEVSGGYIFDREQALLY